MLCMGRMKQSGSQFIATPYYRNFKYSINNAEEEMVVGVDWKKCK